ncbi:MAG: DUF3134 domain-containing protein [Cyanobacteriota bacterium]|nr:DUF3134 domain-containing protein [Cyanobacteriota bacterium]
MVSDNSELQLKNPSGESPPLHNRALVQESRYEPASVIPLKRDSSLLDWLERKGRLLPREKQEAARVASDVEEDDISGLIEEEDRDYDDFEEEEFAEAEG